MINNMSSISLLWTLNCLTSLCKTCLNLIDSFWHPLTTLESTCNLLNMFWYLLPPWSCLIHFWKCPQTCLKLICFASETCWRILKLSEAAWHVMLHIWNRLEAYIHWLCTCLNCSEHFWNIELSLKLVAFCFGIGSWCLNCSEHVWNYLNSLTGYWHPSCAATKPALVLAHQLGDLCTCNVTDILIVHLCFVALLAGPIHQNMELLWRRPMITTVKLCWVLLLR